jgi:tRNA(Ile)-lysidine synthase
MSRLRKSSDEIISIVYRTIRKYGLFESGDSVLVGVSGGPDSVGLLHVLIEIAPTLCLKLGIAHLNHGLRGSASDREAEFVASLAERFQMAFYTEKTDVRGYRRRHKLSLEEAARHLRYRFFAKIAEQNGFDKIALGHHQDDNAELVLMYMIRGSGPLGLSGIPPLRDGGIVRPIMGLTRSQILDFLAEKKINAVSDASNTDNGFIRNRVRNRLIPVIKENYNPRIIETLNRQTCIIRDEEKWIETVVEPIFRNMVIAEQDDGITISVPELAGLHTGAKRRVIRRAIRQVKGNLRRIGFSHVAAVIRLSNRGPSLGTLDLPDRIRVARSGHFLTISREKSALRSHTRYVKDTKTASYTYTISGQAPIFIREINAYLKFAEIDRVDLSRFAPADHPVAYFDRERIRFPLVLRNVRPGDRFTPMGMIGTQKVKTYFINNKVERTRRANCPILLSRDKIIWVVGHRIDDSGKVLPSTRNVLKVELFLA